MTRATALGRRQDRRPQARRQMKLKGIVTVQDIKPQTIDRNREAMRLFTTTVMNFYSFDADGKICKDVAATGIAGILQGIGAIP